MTKTQEFSAARMISDREGATAADFAAECGRGFRIVTSLVSSLPSGGGSAESGEPEVAAFAGAGGFAEFEATLAAGVPAVAPMGVDEGLDGGAGADDAELGAIGCAELSAST